MSINHNTGCPPGQAPGNCLRKRALQHSWMRRAAPHAAVPWPANPGHRQQASQRQRQASLCKHHQLRQPQVCAAASSLAAASDPSPQRQKGSPSNSLPQQRQLDLHADAASTSGKEEEPERPDKSLFDRLVSPVISIMAACLRFLKRLLLPQKGLKRQAFGSLVMLIVGFLLIGRHAIGTGHMASSPQEVTYSRFVHMVHAGNVRAARIDDSADRVVFDVHTPATRIATIAAQEAGLTPAESSNPASASFASAGAATETAAVVRSGVGSSPSQFYTRCIKDPNLIPLLVTAGVEFGALRVGLMDVVLKLLASTLVVWLPMIPLFYLMRRALDSKTGSAAKKKKTNKDVPVITFRDVAGVDSAKVELLEVVACLQDARRYAKLNAKMPSGVLLCGPPGTGKTLLAKAVAGEAGVPFFAASASEFVELFVGRGAARIRDLFAEARKRAPSVVFIDELDAVGGKRGLGLNEERDQTLNQLLTELDGFEGRQGVLLLAATNRAQVLDSALTRPGRLSRKVVVPLPDRQGREDILNVHLRPKPMISAAEKAEAAQVISRLTGGFSGAELANVVDEAACLAARQGAEVVQLKELVEAVSRTRFGISGGSAGIAPVQGLRKRFNDWLVELMSSSRRVQSSPMGQ